MEHLFKISPILIGFILNIIYYRKLRNNKTFIIILLTLIFILIVIRLLDDFTEKTLFIYELYSPIFGLFMFKFLDKASLFINKRHMLIWLRNTYDFDYKEDQEKNITDVIFSMLIIITLIGTPFIIDFLF